MQKTKNKKTPSMMTTLKCKRQNEMILGSRGAGQMLPKATREQDSP